MSKISSLTKQDIAINTKLMDEYKSLNWEDGWDADNKKENFGNMLRLAEIAGTTFKDSLCLDVGCGTGDFSKLLRNQKIKEYVGIDIYKPALKEAQKKYPGEKFIEGDILSGILDGQQFTYAFCSGGLTDNLSIDNYDYITAMISKMWELSIIGITFNFLTDEDPDPDPDLFFYNISRVLDICEDIDNKAHIQFGKSKTVCQTHVFMWR